MTPVMVGPSLMQNLHRMVESLSHVSVWATDLDGTVVLCAGGGLALLGLTPEAVQGTHVSQWHESYGRMHVNALRGLSELERTTKIHSVTQGVGRSRETVTQWAPHYMVDSEGNRSIAGMVAFSIDITTMSEDTMTFVLGRFDDWTPYIQRLANAEVERLNAMAENDRRRMELMDSRWSVLVRFAEWFKERVTVPTTIILVAAALFIAKTLGVLDLVAHLATKVYP